MRQFQRAIDSSSNPVSGQLKALVRLRDAPNRISSGDILCHDTASYFGLGWQFMELVSFFLRSQLRLVRRPAITAPTSPSLSLGISSKCWLSISPAPRGLWSMLPSL